MTYNELLTAYNSQLNMYKKNPFFNRRKIKETKLKIQALEEGQRQDVLTPSVTGVTTVAEVVDKNNYPTYSGQVQSINEMYNNRTDYSGEFLRAVLDTRVSFIIGEGLTIKSDDKRLVKWINSFLDFNKLRGSKSLDSVLTGEMEGKCLWILKADNKAQQVKVKRLSYYNTPYTVNTDEDDDEQIKNIEFQGSSQEAEIKKAKQDISVYIKLGGSPDRKNRTPPVIANVLTDIENSSRCKYDLRKNNHLFGRITPFFQTQSNSEAKALNGKIIAENWKVGKAFTGTAEFSLVEPSGRALESLKEELVILMKHISLNTKIPIQWLAYPELLSNRATADNMIEMINAGTIRERTIWEEAYTELIRKAMVISFMKGWIKFNKPDDFIVEIPQVSIALLEQIQSVWMPLSEAGYISRDTTRGKVPGIDPSVEKELLERQEKEDTEKGMKVEKDKLLNNNAIGDAIAQNNKKGEEVEKEEGKDIV
jgi:hypothetical protein